MDRLVREGFFKTKSEAVRAGILGLGKEYDLVIKPITDARAIKKLKKIEAEIKSGKRKTESFEAAAKRYGFSLEKD